VTRALAAVLAGLAVAVLTACAGRAPFDDTSFTDVERALVTGDLAVCSRSTNREGLANQAIATRTYVVALDCTDDADGSVRLVVDRFDDAEHRDGAARHFESLLRPRGDGAVWTWGPFTLFANGARDDDVMESITDALDRAGAR
jgi:hypothetical protein